MKIILLDMRKLCGKSIFWLKFTCYFIILAFVVEISGIYFSKSEGYSIAAIAAAEKQTVIIDAGHGGEDCGAIGINGVYEKDLNLEVALLLGGMLSERGYAVIYTRTQDRLLYTEEENIKGIRKISDLKNRCKIGAENPYAIFVSIHMNTYSSPKYSGLQVYYGIKNDASYALSNSIQSSVKSELQETNGRVVKAGGGIYLLENLDNVAVLIECGFISNEAECEKLCEKEYQKQLCFRIVCGIIDYTNSFNSD